MIQERSNLRALPAVARIRLWVATLLLLLIAPAAQAVDEILELEQRMEKLKEAGRWAEAERIGLQMIEMSRNDPLSLAASEIDLSTLYLETGAWHKAEPYAMEAWRILEQKFGADHVLTASAITNVAEIYRRRAQLAESEKLYRRALKAREAFYGPRHEDVASAISNLAVVLDEQGRFAESEPLQLRALALRRQLLGDNSLDVADSFYNLGHFYFDQNRLGDAKHCFRESLKRYEAMFGGKHPGAVQVLQSLAGVHHDLREDDEAERLYLEAQRIAGETLAPEHFLRAGHGGLAELYSETGRYDKAEAMLRAIIAFDEKTYGPDSPTTALALHHLAKVMFQKGQLPEAISLWDRVIKIYVAHEGNPQQLMTSYVVRGESHWRAGQREAAVADARRALEYAEAKRKTLSGGERERARASENMQRFVYQTCAAIFLDAGLVDEAMKCVEASRSRALVEQMQSAHVDLLSGVAADEARGLRQQEEQARSQLAILESEARVLEQRRDVNENERARQLEQLSRQLATARQRVVDAYTAIRSASPVYRRILGDDFAPISLERLQSVAAAHNALVLSYSIGDERSWVIAIGGSQPGPRVHRFKLSADQQRRLGFQQAELTAGLLERLLMNDTNTGALQLISRPATSNQSADLLNALYELLIPAGERAALVDERVKRIVIIPDGALALLPFEALVVEISSQPKYLIDVAAPISYTPSATILVNVSERSPNSATSPREPVLTLGDPAYPLANAAANEQRGAGGISARYASLGGGLNRLPHSGQEAVWVSENFRKQKIPALLLRNQSATEQAVRSQSPGRRVLHLACHGLTDQDYGNFFGSLALAPGVRGGSSADDGFLTLAETYELDLRSCELAILSACQTNYGPHQRGEGVWSLTRGFLVAGSRRVVASNWLVDDAAAASLISYYCGILAQQEHEGQTPDYAQALRDAKRWVRETNKWKSPYYWATFVQIGGF